MIWNVVLMRFRTTTNHSLSLSQLEWISRVGCVRKNPEGLASALGRVSLKFDAGNLNTYVPANAKVATGALHCEL